ncbi:DUF6631 family protein [Neptuniibacter sp.]|uniref:DUF6631 family protein n=1 Tax=Neptuniibacter sp. TaxID=1962643 RepID=UPI003B5AE9B8
MANKLEVEDPQNDDLVILHPEQDVTIHGRKLTVREYGFVEGLKLRPLMKPLLDDLYQLQKNGHKIDLDATLDAVANHTDIITRLIATSAEVEAEWVAKLNDADGHLLFMTWWGVCGPFFVRKLSDRMMTDLLQLQAQKRALAGVTSTPPSSTTATAPTESEPTPNAS